MKLLSLFSGIGGLDLGIERAGLARTVAWCQASSEVLGDGLGYADHAIRVLSARWPSAVGLTCSVAEVSPARLGQVDVVAGGFPCQDLSVAGKGAGLDGARSGLWFEMLRIIEEARPRIVIAENVSALQSRGLSVVAAGLQSAGYAVWVTRIQAADLGAPHRRERLLIVGVRGGAHGPAEDVDALGGRWELLPVGWTARPVVRWREGEPPSTFAEAGAAWPTPAVANRANTCEGVRRPGLGEAAATWGAAGALSPSWVESLMGFPFGWTDPAAEPAPAPGWPMPQGPEKHAWEPPRTVPPRVLPSRRQRIATLGNAVVPAVGEVAARWAVELLAGRTPAQGSLWR